MAIELITGSPGAGKTTYAVGARMAEEVGRPLTYEDALGVKHTAERRIVAGGFRGLLLEHETIPHPLTDHPDSADKVTKADIERWNLCDAEDMPLMARRPFDPPILEEVVNGKTIPLKRSLFNWWMWVMPGDLLCYDEVQFVVPRGTVSGVRQAPFWIRCCEIHRHYGIDMLFITQHPQLLDMPFRALANPHRHVRSVLGSPLCMVYVWDHASNPERYSSAMKTRFVRRAKHHRLFKSTVAVMRQPAAGKLIFWVAPLCIGLLGWYGYRAFQKNTDKRTPAPALAASAPSSSTPATFVAGYSSAAPATAAWTPVPGFPDVPKLAGCYTVGERCSCLGVDGRPVSIALPMCRISAASYDGLVRYEPRAPLPPPQGQPTPPAAPAPVPAPLPALRGPITSTPTAGLPSFDAKAVLGGS